MATGLRERWRINAMRTIQEKALDLFDERGFDAVTIEEIAAAAEVSPSSVYRYFGTKEGLVVADEFDSWSQEAVEEILDVNDPVGSLLQVVLRYEAAPEQGPQAETSPWRRVRYFFQEPSVRMAACAALDRASQRIAPLMMTGGMTETQARVAANALVFGYFGALEQWYLDGGVRPIAHYVEEGLLPLRRIWSKPNGPGLRRTRCRAIAGGSRQNAVSMAATSGAACSSGPMWPEPGRMARAPLRRWAAAARAAAIVHIGSSALVVSSVGVSRRSSTGVRSGRPRLSQRIASNMPRRSARRKAPATIAAPSGSSARAFGPRSASTSGLTTAPGPAAGTARRAAGPVGVRRR